MDTESLCQHHCLSIEAVEKIFKEYIKVGRKMSFRINGHVFSCAPEKMIHIAQLKSVLHNLSFKLLLISYIPAEYPTVGVSHTKTIAIPMDYIWQLEWW
jgi:hypothetical protein